MGLNQQYTGLTGCSGLNIFTGFSAHTHFSQNFELEWLQRLGNCLSAYHVDATWLVMMPGIPVHQILCLMDNRTG